MVVTYVILNQNRKKFVQVFETEIDKKNFGKTPIWRLALQIIRKKKCLQHTQNHIVLKEQFTFIY